MPGTLLVVESGAVVVVPGTLLVVVAGGAVVVPGTLLVVESGAVVVVPGTLLVVVAGGADVVPGTLLVVTTAVDVAVAVVVTAIGAMWHVGTQYNVCDTFSCGSVTVALHCAAPLSTNVNPLLVVSFVVQNTHPDGKWDAFMHLVVSVFCPVVLRSMWFSCGHRSTHGSASPGLPCRRAASAHASSLCV